MRETEAQIIARLERIWLKHNPDKANRPDVPLPAAPFITTEILR